jgi:hypothetical protein
MYHLRQKEDILFKFAGLFYLKSNVIGKSTMTRSAFRIHHLFILIFCLFIMGACTSPSDEQSESKASSRKERSRKQKRRSTAQRTNQLAKAQSDAALRALDAAFEEPDSQLPSEQTKKADSGMKSEAKTDPVRDPGAKEIKTEREIDKSKQSARADGEKQVITIDDPGSEVPAIPPIVATIQEEKAVPIECENGGTVELTDGFTIIVPAGALKNDSTVEVQHVMAGKEENHLIADFEFYQVTAKENGSELNQPALVRLPYDPEALGDVDPGEIRVSHRLASGQVEEIQPRVNRQEHYVEVDIDSFSGLARYWPGDYAGLGKERIEHARQNGAVMVRTSYYSQHTSQWCWAACLAMMVSSCNRNIQTQEVAEIMEATVSQMGQFKTSYAQSVPLVSGVYVDLPKLQNAEPVKSMEFDVYTTGAITEGDWRGFLISLLDKGHPVLVNLAGFLGHVVLLVGYDASGFFVHDSEGKLLEHLGLTADNAKLGYYHVTFDQWSTAVDLKSWFFVDVVVPTKVTPEVAGEQRKALTIQILPDWCIRFVRQNGVEKDIYLYWNGRVLGGCGFSAVRQDSVEHMLGREGLCNSDRLDVFKALIHNMGLGHMEDSFTGRLEVWLSTMDGATRGRLSNALKKTSEIRGRTANHEENLLWGETSAASQPGARYIGINERAELSLKDGLDFTRNPLEPGEYVLEVELLPLNGNQPIDRAQIPFRMHPAVVTGLQAEDAVTLEGHPAHRVSWGPCGDEHWSSDKLEYVIYRNIWKQSGGQPYRLEEAVATIDEGIYETLLELPSDAQGDDILVTYQVVAKLTRGNEEYSSPFSRPVEAPRSEVSGPFTFRLEEALFTRWDVLNFVEHTKVEDRVAVPTTSPYERTFEINHRGDDMVYEVAYEFPTTLTFSSLVSHKARRDQINGALFLKNEADFNLKTKITGTALVGHSMYTKHLIHIATLVPDRDPVETQSEEYVPGMLTLSGPAWERKEVIIKKDAQIAWLNELTDITNMDELTAGMAGEYLTSVELVERKPKSENHEQETNLHLKVPANNGIVMADQRNDGPVWCSVWMEALENIGQREPRLPKYTLILRYKLQN